jgi:hypothetical protein
MVFLRSRTQLPAAGVEFPYRNQNTPYLMSEEGLNAWFVCAQSYNPVAPVLNSDELRYGPKLGTAMLEKGRGGSIGRQAYEILWAQKSSSL